MSHLVGWHAALYGLQCSNLCLPRNSVIRITECSNMASAVYCGRTCIAINQPTNQMHLLYTNLFLWKTYLIICQRNSQKCQQELLLHSPVLQSMKIYLSPNVHDEKKMWKLLKSVAEKLVFSNHQKVKMWRLFNLLYRELTQSKLCRPIESALQLLLHFNYWQLSFKVFLTSPHLQETLYNACFCFSSLPYTQKNYKCSLSQAIKSHPNRQGMVDPSPCPIPLHTHYW